MEQLIAFTQIEATRAFDQRVRTEDVLPISLAARFLQRPEEPRLHALFDSLPAAIYITDAEGRLTYFNAAAATFWGRRPVLGISEWCGSWKLFWPDGRPMAYAGCPMAIALRDKRPVRGIEAVIERPDGTRVPFLPYPTPLFDEDGALTGAINMLVDLSERKRAEEQRELMVRELHHRVKNTLATVQAIVGSTARLAPSAAAFTEMLTGRIHALAKTHLLLSEQSEGVVGFADILRNELGAFEGSEGRIRLSGPPVAIPARLTVALGMAIHELTTNAARHGALSVPGGTVTVRWKVTIEAARRLLAFDWVESGGPPVARPHRTGFGTQLLELVMPGQVQAKGDIVYARKGVRVRYEVPMAWEG